MSKKSSLVKKPAKAFDAQAPREIAEIDGEYAKECGLLGQEYANKAQLELSIAARVRRIEQLKVEAQLRSQLDSKKEKDAVKTEA